MSVRFDDKGKYFTEFVPKNGLEVLIECQHCRIQGLVFAREGQRLKDAVNTGDQFLAVTGARVYDFDGSLLYRSKFLVLNRTSIEWIIPLHEMVGDESQQESAG